MKFFLPLVIALTTLVSVSNGATGDVGFPDELMESPAFQSPYLRRMQEGSTSTDTPTPTTPTPTETPAPTTATPTTTPTPTTATPTESPAPTTATPTQSPTPTPTPATPSSSTGSSASGSSGNTSPSPAPSPTSTAGNSSSGNGSTTSAPTTTTATPTTTAPVTTVPSTVSSSASGSTSASVDNQGSTDSAASAGTEDDSSMSTGTVIGIVAGIICGVALMSLIAMCVIRKRKNEDDDPLSPFELSMDKGYGAGPAFMGQSSYNTRPAPGRELSDNTNTPEAGAVAAGVAYSEFYDTATSPGSINRQDPQTRMYPDNQDDSSTTNGTNLWMSAMEPKENDSYLSAHESIHDSDQKSYTSGRNSYDQVDNDQTSQLSGSSDLNSHKDFPDFEDESARGSYEL